MNVKLFIEENNYIKLCPFSGKKKIGCLEWQDENDLSVRLLINLDKLLSKFDEKLDKNFEYKIISEVPQKWTTYRIAEITLNSLKIGAIAKK